ncbi:GTP-binding protein [archaeon]|nr:GTP-binding protein [archaeon]
MTKEEKIKELEEELRTTKYNKRTQHHVGLIKAKIAKLKQPSSSSKSIKPLFSVKKTGDATVILIGPPSVGKSTLLNKITNANTKTAAYQFTTLKPIPGILNYKNSKIQLIDLPGIIEGASEGKGRGREVLSTLRNADLVIILLDPKTIKLKEKIEKELEQANIRLNKQPPKIKLTKEQKGGLKIHSNLQKETVTSILKEFKIQNGDITTHNVTIDQLIDFLEGNKVYIPSITVINKSDLLKQKTPFLEISVTKNKNLDKLKEQIFNKLDIMQIFLKQVGKEPDLEEPLIIKNNSTIKDVCLDLHKDFLTKFDFARVWGSSVKHDGQKVLKTTHLLKNKDILEIHLK